MEDFSHRNIKYVYQFAFTYPDFQIWPSVVAQLPYLSLHSLYCDRFFFAIAFTLCFRLLIA